MWTTYHFNYKNKVVYEIHKILICIVFLIFSVEASYSQPSLPNRSISVRATQGLDFGMICVNTGGTITITPEGTRNAIGVIPAGAMYHPAVFEISLCQGRMVRLNFPETITLNGSNGGVIYLSLTTDKGAGGSPFPVEGNCNFVTPLYVGGTLTIDGAALPGLYSGSFDITFNQE